MNPTRLTERFDEALMWAMALHRGQLRKDGRTPYAAHLLSVTALVLEDGGTEDEAIAALLHDAVEDRGGTAVRAEIYRHFGDGVGAIVDGCTESEITPKPPWGDRKQRYLDQIARGSAAVRRVSLADKLHNARDTLLALRTEGPRVWDRFHGGKGGTLWFYRSLLDNYRDRGRLWREFARTVEELAQF